MEGVLLSAGYATRFGGIYKCGLLLNDAHLAHYPLSAMASAGIRRIVFVCNKFNEEACSFLASTVNDFGIETVIKLNEKPDLGNGFSLLKGLEELTENVFVASVCDHVYHPEIVRRVKTSLNDFYMVVAADKNPKLVNIDEATKVLARGNAVVKVGKELKEFTHIDAGVFAGKTSEVLERFKNWEGKLTLSDMMNALAEEGRAGIAEFEGLPWFDLDEQREVELCLKGPRKGYAEWLRRGVWERVRTDPFLPLSIEKFRTR